MFHRNHDNYCLIPHKMDIDVNVFCALMINRYVGIFLSPRWNLQEALGQTRVDMAIGLGENVRDPLEVPLAM